MPKLIELVAEGITKEELENMSSPPDGQDPESGSSGPVISWQNVGMSVGSKKILKDVGGSVSGGKVCAVMGPSGAGKSSLLNVLAGRSASRGKTVVEAYVEVDGNAVDPVAFRKNVAYVMQDDALVQTATPREALAFSAALRLTVSKAEQVTLPCVSQNYS